MTPKNTAFIDIAKAIYNANGLAYHNVDHIRNVLIAAEQLSGNLTGKKASTELVLAIWYHDVVIDTRRTDNERTSATLFLEIGDVLVKTFPQNDFNPEKVCSLIGLTSKHLVELNDNNLDTEDRIILDSDLAGLGKVQLDTYLTTMFKIRKEYSHLSEELYRKGRIRFLSKLNAKDIIYYSEPAREGWEVQARSNIEQELDLLNMKAFT